MHYANIALGAPTKTLDVPAETIRNHQIQITAGEGVNSGALAVQGRTPGASTFGALGTIDFSDCPEIKVFEGVYAELKFVPTNEDDYPYGVAYVGW